MDELLDRAILCSCPVVAAPRYGALTPCELGQRVVVAKDGVYLQTRLPWLECVHRIADIDYPTLPYGTVRPYVRFAFGAVPPNLLADFIELARARLPNECAASLVYSAATGTLQLLECVALDRSPQHIHYAVAMLQPDDLVAVDLHSHGLRPAFFSPQDDADDRGLAVSMVFGRLDASVPECYSRLVINGYHIPLPRPWPPPEVRPVDGVDRELS